MFKYSLIWSVIILITAIIPGTYIPEVQNIWSLLQWDKLIHIFLFTVFVGLLINDLRKQKKVRSLQNNSVIFALLCGIFFGLLTEMIQLFECFHRNSNLFDFIANVIGTILGKQLYNGLYKKKLQI